jgi:hypothetical protein
MLTPEQLDALHDEGGDLTPYLDRDKSIRPGRSVQRVNVDFPTDLLRTIDAEATRIGVSRQAFIKMRLADVVTPVAAGEPRVVNLMEALQKSLDALSKGRAPAKKSKAADAA